MPSVGDLFFELRHTTTILSLLTELPIGLAGAA